MTELPHKKNKKHKKHKSKKKKRKKKGEKESSSESGAESDVEPPPPPKPVRNTRSRSVLSCTFSRIHIAERNAYTILIYEHNISFILLNYEDFTDFSMASSLHET